MLRYIIILFFLFFVTVSASAKSPVDPSAQEADITNRHTVACPAYRLQKDWLFQDCGTFETGNYFVSDSSNEGETKIVQKIITELQKRGVSTEEHEKMLAGLLETKKPGNDTKWKDFYFLLCEQRRKARLAVFDQFPRQYVYAKHHVFGDCQAMFAMTTHQTDAEYRECGKDYQMGSELCLMTISGEGNITTEILYDCPTGVLRDPCVSFDGKRIAFSMRKNDVDDDFHLYVMNVADRSVHQITYGQGTCDVEPCYLPSGEIIFESTRCANSAPCWWSNVTNLYTCDGEGRYIRRLSYDHAHTIYPSVLPDGRITYTRWEYADRASGAIQPAMVMNEDGTMQTEFYGNNSFIPISLFHIRGIPGTQNAVGIMSGHHVDQRGKLMLIDRTKGVEENKGLKYICPEKVMDKPNLDKNVFYSKATTFGYHGEQFQYPYPLDEKNFLVSYMPNVPDNWYRGPYPVKFGIYWMGIDGEREMLIYDPTIASGQVFPLTSREVPQSKPTAVNQNRDDGTFYVQDVYYGPGLNGIERGTVKKLRVIGLEGRAAGTSAILLYPGGGYNTTSIAINNGSYDVKHVLGEVDVEDDGSVHFTVPARTPVYFQLLDEKGYTVQTMRSWTVLQPGETFSCVGCHEDKNNSIISNSRVTKASRKSPQKLVPFFKEGEEPVQEQIDFFTEEQKRAYQYLGINAPQGEDVPRGFSYRREIQPIWDTHCIQCHTGTKNPDKQDVPLSLLGDSKEYNKDEAFLDYKWLDVNRGKGEAQVVGRDFSESYINLTKYGQPNEWVNNLIVFSQAEMIPPYYFGSSKSGLMKYLEPSHYNVQLTQKEKNRVACWIDLCIPYCGSFMEANTWDQCRNKFWYRYNDQLRGVYLYHEAKRLRFAMVEVDHLNKYKAHLATGQEFLPEEFVRMDFGGQKIQKEFLDHFKVKNQQVPIHGIVTGLDSRGGTTVADNPLRNLALNPSAATHQIRSYPYASSNSHHKYRAEFSPKNLINGNKSPDTPFWKPDPRTDLWVKIDFGRECSVEKTVIYLKKLPGQKKTWTSAALTFSDGSKIPIELKFTDEPQEFNFPPKKTSFVQLTDLKETFPLTLNGIAEWEIFGRD